MHEDAVTPGEIVVLVDDVIATGGTAKAGVSLLRRLGAKVAGASFIVELPKLGGARAIEALGVPVRSLVQFASNPSD